jgi:phosphoserine phosphatase
MGRILLVRHGETIWNHELRYQGHCDVPLSDVGREQAKALMERLKNVEIHSFYASDLSRAKETAEIIAGPHKKEVNSVFELRETNFGEWEGLSYNDIGTKYKELLDQWILDPENVRIPGGETLREVAKRCNIGLQKIIKEHQNETVLIVAHGGINRLILSKFLRLPLNRYWQIKQDNVALNVIDIYENNKVIVGAINDVGHLKILP